MAADPFYAVRDALQVEVDALRVRFEAWRAALGTVNTASDTSFQRMHQEVHRELSKTAEMCRKVKAALSNIEQRRDKFAHIDDRELDRRKESVDRLDKMLVHMNDVFTSRETRGKIEADQRKQLAARVSDEVAAVGSRAPAGPSAHNMANADYMRDQAQQQSQLRREQDQGLDKIGNTLDRLNEMAVTIDSELKEQDKILADIDTEMDTAQNKMDGAIKSVEKLLKTKDKCQLCVIAGLTLTFVIVAIIAIYSIT